MSAERIRAPRTAAQRKAAERARLREQGFVLKEVWVRPDDWPRLQAYAARLAGPVAPAPKRGRPARARTDA